MPIGNNIYAGPLARSVTDAAIMHSVLVGPSDKDPWTLSGACAEAAVAQARRASDLAAVRIGYIELTANPRVAADVRANTRASLAAWEAMGAEVEEVTDKIDWIEYEGRVLYQANFAVFCAQYLPKWQNQMDPVTLAFMERGAKFTLADFRNAQFARTTLFRKIQSLFERYDFLVMPTNARTALDVTHDAANDEVVIDGVKCGITRQGWTSYQYPFNLTGHPACAYPSGFGTDGLPTSVQVVGKWGAETDVLRLGALLEARAAVGAAPAAGALSFHNAGRAGIDALHGLRRSSRLLPNTNRRNLMRLIAVLSALFGFTLGSGAAFAQAFDKPIKIMAPYAPGGNIDVTARIIADKLREVLGITVIVENKAGASGMIGSDIVARSAPDGTSLLVSANSLVAVPAIYGNAPYDWRTAFTPITHIQRVPAVLVVPPNSPIKTLADFIALGKDGKFAVADSGVGTTNHIAIELIGEATGTKYTLVHYKGSGAAMIDVMAGQVPAQVDQLNAAIGNIKSGKLRAIAVSSDKRVPQLPDVPTIKESRREGSRELHLLRPSPACSGPAKMPPDVVAKINEAMVKVLKDPAVVQRFADLTAEAYPTTPQETAAMFDAEDKMVVPLIKKLQIKPE